MKLCEKKLAPKRRFDKRSFRWVFSGKARVLVACPIGAWSPRAMRCTKGLRAYKILTPANNKRCPLGSKRITK